VTTSLAALRSGAAHCTRCGLYKPATQTVLGETNMREGPAGQVHTNPVAAAEPAEAERALALHHATEEQIERLHDADRYQVPVGGRSGARLGGVGSPGESPSA
jgi:hypothetical protein